MQETVSQDVGRPNGCPIHSIGGCVRVGVGYLNVAIFGSSRESSHFCSDSELGASLASLQVIDYRGCDSGAISRPALLLP